MLRLSTLTHLTLAASMMLGVGCSKYTEECHAAHLVALDLNRTYPDLRGAALRGDRAKFETLAGRVEALAKKLGATKMSGDSHMDSITQRDATEYAGLVEEAVPALKKLLEAVEAHKASGGEGPAPTLSSIGLDSATQEHLNVDMTVSRNMWESKDCKR